MGIIIYWNYYYGNIIIRDYFKKVSDFLVFLYYSKLLVFLMSCLLCLVSIYFFLFCIDFGLLMFIIKLYFLRFLIDVFIIFECLFVNFESILSWFNELFG